MTNAARLWLIPLVLVFALTAACGGDDDSADQTSPTATAADSTEGADETAAADEDAASPTDAPTVETSIDPCTLLTPEELEAALELTPAEPEHGSSGPYATCTWNTQEVSLKFVIVQLHEGVSTDDFRSATESAASFIDVEAKELDGLGDAAYDVGGYLYAHKGNFELVMTNVLGYDLTDPDQAAQAQEVNVTLMQQALARVPE